MRLLRLTSGLRCVQKNVISGHLRGIGYRPFGRAWRYRQRSPAGLGEMNSLAKLVRFRRRGTVRNRDALSARWTLSPLNSKVAQITVHKARVITH